MYYYCRVFDCQRSEYTLDSCNKKELSVLFPVIVVPACLGPFLIWGCWYLQSGVIDNLQLGPIVADCRRSVVIGHVYDFTCRCACMRVMPEFKIEILCDLILLTICAIAKKLTNNENN